MLHHWGAWDLLYCELLQGCFAYKPRERLSVGEALHLLSEAMRTAGVEPVERRAGSLKAGSSSTSVLEAASTTSTSTGAAGRSSASGLAVVLRSGLLLDGAWGATAWHG